MRDTVHRERMQHYAHKHYVPPSSLYIPHSPHATVSQSRHYYPMRDTVHRERMRDYTHFHYAPPSSLCIPHSPHATVSQSCHDYPMRDTVHRERMRHQAPNDYAPQSSFCMGLPHSPFSLVSLTIWNSVHPKSASRLTTYIGPCRNYVVMWFEPSFFLLWSMCVRAGDESMCTCGAQI